MSAFNSIRMIRKEVAGEEVVTHCTSLTLERCSELLAIAANKQPPMPATTLAAKLHIFTRDVAEGFFAEKVVLVEGGTDKAIIEGAYTSRGRSPAGEGIAVISMSGKSTLDKPFLIFSELGVPTFMIFDNDENKSAKRQQHRDSNILLQRLTGAANVEDFPKGIADRYAVMLGDLEVYIRDVLGDVHDDFMQEVCERFELGFEDLRKTPEAVSALLTLARGKGYEFHYLDQIVAAVDALTARP